MIRVVILDNQELVRIGLKTVLEQDTDINVVAELDTLDTLAECVQRAKPDIILLGAEHYCQQWHTNNMQDEQPGFLQAIGQEHSKNKDDFLAFAKLKKLYPAQKIVLLSTNSNLDCLMHTLCGHVSGYLLKSIKPIELICAMHAVVDGGTFIHSIILSSFPKHILRDGAGLTITSFKIPLLSVREQDVLDLLVKGHTNKEISEELFLSPKTVEAYRARIYTKLGVKSRSGLFSCAVEYGLVAI